MNLVYGSFGQIVEFMCEGDRVGLQIHLISRVTLTIVVLVVWDLFCGSSEESLEFVLTVVVAYTNLFDDTF